MPFLHGVGRGFLTYGPVAQPIALAVVYIGE
jgi:hypothetical protein